MSTGLTTAGAVQWVGGSWVAVVTPRGVMLLPPTADDDIVTDLWELLRAEGTSMVDLMDALLVSSGGHIGSLPEFAAVIAEEPGAMHVLVRGRPVVFVDGSKLDCEGVETWYETTLGAAQDVRVIAPEELRGRTRPVVDAIVSAAALLLGGAKADGDIIPQAPVPGEQPALEEQPSAVSLAPALAEEPEAAQAEDGLPEAVAETPAFVEELSAAALAPVVTDHDQAAAEPEEAPEGDSAPEAADPEPQEEGAPAPQDEDLSEPVDEVDELADSIHAEPVTPTEDLEDGAPERSEDSAQEPASTDDQARTETDAELGTQVEVEAGQPGTGSADLLSGTEAAAEAEAEAVAADETDQDDSEQATEVDFETDAAEALQAAPEAVQDTETAQDEAETPQADSEQADSDPAPGAEVAAETEHDAVEADAAAPARGSRPKKGRKNAKGKKPETVQAQEPEAQAAPAPEAETVQAQEPVAAPLVGQVPADELEYEPEAELGPGMDFVDDFDDFDEEGPAPAAVASQPGAEADGQVLSSTIISSTMDQDLPEALLAELDAEFGVDLDAASSNELYEDRYVLAFPCPKGHANPTSRSHCRVCGEELVLPAQRMACPSLGTVTMSSGEVISLDRDLVVGRQPDVTSFAMGDVPPLAVVVPSPERLISRNHVHIMLEEWAVLVEDLATRNGTILCRDGEDPVRMAPGTSVLIRNGDELVLGDGQSLVFEDLP